MFKFLVFAIPLLISSVSGATPLSRTHVSLALSQKRYINLNNTAIGGLKIGMSESEVIKKLGAPKSRQVSANGCTGTDDIALKYNSLDIYLLGGADKTSKSYLTAITTSNSRYITSKGIRVGDLMSKAEKAYSKTAITSEKGRYLSLVDLKQNECALAFSSDDSKTVSEISLACAIC
jgi:hypothetical protein